MARCPTLRAGPAGGFSPRTPNAPQAAHCRLARQTHTHARGIPPFVPMIREGPAHEGSRIGRARAAVREAGAAAHRAARAAPGGREIGDPCPEAGRGLRRAGGGRVSGAGQTSFRWGRAAGRSTSSGRRSRSAPGRVGRAPSRRDPTEPVPLMVDAVPGRRARGCRAWPDRWR